MGNILGVIFAYIVGAIPTSYLVGTLKGVDIRKHGSGNVGATNVLRVMGKLPALITLTADIGKGILAVTLIALFFYRENNVMTPNAYRTLLGLAVIIGHNWSIFLKFNGGKGVAAFIGVFSVIFPVGLLVGLIVWGVTVWLTKYVSLGSILLAMTIPIVAAITGAQIEVVFLAVTCCIIICYKHKGNIGRLLSGTERKIEENDISA